MKKRTRVISGIVVILFLLSAAGYGFSPYITAYTANRHLDAGGVKLMMTRPQLEALLGKGEELAGFGADFYQYKDRAIIIAYPNDGLFRGKASMIDISDPSCSFYGVKPGDALDKAADILENLGFRQDQNNKEIFVKGNIMIGVYGSFVRVRISDWRTNNRIY